MFSAVMRMVIDHGHPSSEHWQLAHSLLQRDPLTDETTSYFRLAMALAEHKDECKPDPAQFSALLSYLRTSAEHWKSKAGVETNLRAYHLLSRLDRSEGYSYESEVESWQKVKIKRDHLQRIPALVEQKKYFLLFNELFMSARYWDIEDDGTREQWLAFNKATSAQHRDMIATWIAEGAETPAPLLNQPPSMVSSRFLWIGTCLFMSPFCDDPEYGRHRESFNDASRNSLDDLNELVLRLPKPKGVQELLSFHARQIRSYAGMEEKGGRFVKAAV
jgi:hypothetical protein